MQKTSRSLLVATLLFFHFLAGAQELSLSSQIQAHQQKKLVKIGSNLQIIAQERLSKFSDRGINDVSVAGISIHAVAVASGSELLSHLNKLGLSNGDFFGRIVSGVLPASSIMPASVLESLHFMSVNHSLTNVGSVTSQGVQASTVDLAVLDYGVTGMGVTVGVISDSYDCFSESSSAEFLARTAAADKASSDLPQSAYALEESLNCDFALDEGRALMQVIHDIAPDAELVFHSGTNGIASTAKGILELVDNIGVNIIVDDSVSNLETYFQDGPIAQAIEYAVSRGVNYVSAAGNSGRNAYQSAYNEVSDTRLNINAHDFDSSSNVDILQEFFLPPGESIQISLQWADPAYSVSGPPGAATDLDLFILNEAGTDIIAGSTAINIARDPIEFVSFTNPENATVTTFNLLVSKAQGPAPSLIKYIIEKRFNGKVNEYTTASGSIAGRANSASAITVGAVNYRQTPAFGEPSPILEFFSSAGGDTPILFGENGERLSHPILRAKPELVGPNDVNTTFFQFYDPDIDSDNDGFPNFLGTSASAPHIAGVVALLLDVNPDFQPNDILNILQTTAIDIVLRNVSLDRNEYTAIDSGSDSDSGFGLVDTLAAVELATRSNASLPSEAIEIPSVNQLEVTQGGGALGLWWLLCISLIVSLRSIILKANL